MVALAVQRGEYSVAPHYTIRCPEDTNWTSFFNIFFVTYVTAPKAQVKCHMTTPIKVMWSDTHTHTRTHI